MQFYWWKEKKKIEFCCLKGEIRKYLKSRSRSSKFVKKDARGEWMGEKLLISIQIELFKSQTTPRDILALEALKTNDLAQHSKAGTQLLRANHRSQV